MNNDAEFDGLLHEALSEYREAEPLAGIESRILARIQDRDARRKTPGWRWALVGACAAALVVAIWFGALRRAPQSAAPNINVATTKPVEKTPAEKPQATAVAAVSRQADVRKRVTHPMPGTIRTEAAAQTKPAVFPLPAPLTAEERAFVAALQRAPDALPVADERDKDIAIAEIQIKPLAIGGLQTSEQSGEKQ